MDILPLLTLLLQANGGAGAPPRGEDALSRLVSALNAPAENEGEQFAQLLSLLSAPARGGQAAQPAHTQGAPADTDALARLLALLQAEAPPAQFAPPPASPDPPARAENTSNPATTAWAVTEAENTSNPAAGGVWAGAREENASNPAAGGMQENEEALAPVRRIANEEILRLLAAALSALNSDL